MKRSALPLVRQGRLERENARLKALVGELTLELKTRQEVPGEPRPLCQGGRPQHRAARAYPGPQERASVPGAPPDWVYLRYVDGLVVNQKRVYSACSVTSPSRARPPKDRMT
jgi:hypothetical protein